MVFEFDPKAKADDPKVAICFYFTTQTLPGKAQEKSEPYCADSKNVEDSKAGKFAAGAQSVPLWNVERITTSYESGTVYDVSFHMRYNNVSDPAGFYKWDDAAAALID